MGAPGEITASGTEINANEVLKQQLEVTGFVIGCCSLCSNNIITFNNAREGTKCQTEKKWESQ